MQRAMLNRATMRVADTTEVCGRVTADSIKHELSVRLISKLALLPVALILLGLTSSTPINIAANASDVKLPFHAVIHGTAVPSFTGPCTFTNHETGSGLAIHLGVITWTSDETVQFLSCPPPGTAIAATNIKTTIVAANGDEIFVEYTTTGTLDPVNGVSVSGGYNFVSGTGRFTNVTGSGVITAHGPGGGPPFDFVGSLDGTISY